MAIISTNLTKLCQNVEDMQTTLGDVETLDGDIATTVSNKLDKTGDSTNVTTSFTSNDTTKDVTSWTDVAALTSNEKHSSIFNKISTMFKNIRYMYKLLGTTDISKIGNGTVTNAIVTSNTELNNFKAQTNMTTVIRSIDLLEYVDSLSNGVHTFTINGSDRSCTNIPTSVGKANFLCHVIKYGNTISITVDTLQGNLANIKRFYRVKTAANTWSDWLETIYTPSIEGIAVDNLIQFPYYRSTGSTSSGVTFTYGEDGIIYANGTATATAYFTLMNNFIPDHDGTITLSIDSCGNGVSVYYAHYDSSGTNLGEYAVRNTDGSVTFDMWTDEYAYCRLGIYLIPGTVCDNVPIKVQVEKGSVAHDYVPYKLSRQSLRDDVDYKIKSGASEASMRIKAFELTFVDGVSTRDLSSYSEGKTFSGLCIVSSQLSEIIAITSSVITNSTLTVRAKNISSTPTPYTGTLTVNVLYFLK